MSRFTTLTTVFLLALGSVPPIQAQSLELTLLGQYHTEVFDAGAAEIAAYDPGSQRLVFVNAQSDEVVAMDISDPAAPKELFTLSMNAFGNEANSVAVHEGIIAVAVEASPRQEPGAVVFFDINGNLLERVAVGALPDALTFTSDGSNVVVANEGEPNSAYTNDPEGSVSIIDLTDGPEEATVTHVTFEVFNEGGPRAGELPEEVRIFGPGATVAQDLEPEFVAVSPEGDKAYVTLQENNAIAVIDLATTSVDEIAALGTKDHDLSGNALDASDLDAGINIQNWPVYGLFMPDGIAAYDVEGETYLVTANEGDAREYSALDEAQRINNLTLDSTVFPDAGVLQENEAIGRLNVTTTLGDTDEDGDYDALYTFGARSFSIWASDGMLIYDSGDSFEQHLAQELPDDFNADNDENNSFDSRSDNKGPEPEGVILGVIDGRTVAFVGLERIGGVMVYDVTDPETPKFVTYANSRDFSVTVTPGELELVGELGPEGLVFIPAADSPNGDDLLIVSHEVSGSVSIYQIDTMQTGTEETDVSGGFVLGESVPNPVSRRYGGTSLSLRVAETQRVTARVYDALGRLVATAHDSALAAGEETSIEVDTASLATGAYVVRVVGETFAETRRVTVVP